MRPKQLKAKDLRAFAVIPIRAIKDPRISPATLRVLVAFCSYADAMGMKLEESVRARLTTKQQIQLGEAEAQMKEQQAQAKAGPNLSVDLELSTLRGEFQCLTRDFFSRAKGAGWWIDTDRVDRAAQMLANQAVELLREPRNDKDAAA